MTKGIYIRTEYHKNSLKVPHKGSGIYKRTSKMKSGKNPNSRNGFKKGHLKFNTAGFQKGHLSLNSPKKENHWNWKGGIFNNPYPSEFNAKLKLKIRIKDNFTCCLCGRTEREELEELNRVLCVNHIDFDKNNCKESNLNTLCVRCNTKINREREYWINYFNNLYEQ